MSNLYRITMNAKSQNIVIKSKSINGQSGQQMSSGPVRRVAKALVLLLFFAWVCQRGSVQSAAAQVQLAQAGNSGIWMPALNLSRSGTASQPLIATGGNGVSHVMWWDSFDGMRYARLTSNISGTVGLSATNSIPLVAIYGDRQTYFDNRLRKQVSEIRPPRDMRLLSDRVGQGHAIWENLSDQLLYAATANGALWSPPILVEQSASAFDAVTDISGTLHIAYVRLGGQAGTNTAAQPGLYYRSRLGAALSVPISILPSNYLRAERADDLALSVAANGRGTVVVTWYQPGQNQSFYAATLNFGKTWTAPQPVSGAGNLPAARSSVAATVNGDFLLIYRDNGASGNTCSFNQRVSSDNGQTWSAPQIILADIGRCPQHWRFANAADKLWMVGTMNQIVSPLAAKGNVNITTNLLAAWDGKAWSSTAEINLNAYDGGTSQNRQLSCFNVSLIDSKLLGVGCDARGDIWTSQILINLNDLMKSPELQWERFKRISNTKGPVGSDIVMARQTDGLVGMWTQAEIAGAPPNQIFFSRWNSTEWTQPSKVIFDARSRYEQLALATGPDERLHLVWAHDRVYYSQSFVRDAGLPEGWAKPVGLPAPVEGSRSPSLIVDPRGSAIYVAYAVPYNEQRGIYLARSVDNGTTWEPTVKIFDAAAAKWDGADQPSIQLDITDNTLYAVWLKLGVGNTDVRTLFYAHSQDAGKTWSKPEELVSGAIQEPQLILPTLGQIQVIWHQARGVYNTAVPYEALGTASTDAGKTWQAAAAIGGFGELSSKPALVTDQAGQVYLTGMAENSNGEGRMIFSAWNSGNWSLVESLGVGQRSAEENRSAVALLPQSGQLVVLARTSVLSDSGNSQFELFSTARQVKRIEVQPVPTFTPPAKVAVNPLSQPALSVEPTPTTMPVINKELQPQTRFAPGFMQLIIGGVVFLGLVIVAFGFYRNRRRS